MKTNTIIESLKAMLSQNGFTTTDGKTYEFGTIDYSVKFNGALVELNEQRGKTTIKQVFNVLKLREFADRTMPIRIALSKDLPFFEWGF
jgi:hypothetical protein